MCLVASGVNRSDVNDLFPGGVSKSTPGKANQAKRNQDHSERFVHGCLLPVEIGGAQMFHGVEPIFLRRAFRTSPALPEFMGESRDVAMGECGDGPLCRVDTRAISRCLSLFIIVYRCLSLFSMCTMLANVGGRLLIG
jgi:hypothetical protein